MKQLFLIILFFNPSYMIAQDLTGKWAMIITDDLYTNPECMVIEITKKELITYSFDNWFGTTKLKIDAKSELFLQGEKEYFVKYKYTLEDSLTLTLHRLSRTNDLKETTRIIDWNYVKLLPTKINYPTDKIIEKQYDHFYRTSFVRPIAQIKLKGLMCNDQVKQLIGEEKCPRYRLEKIDDTYLIVYYSNADFRKWMVPIKEINEDHLLVYGIAGKEGFIKLNELKEINNESKVYIPDN